MGMMMAKRILGMYLKAIVIVINQYIESRDKKKERALPQELKVALFHNQQVDPLLKRGSFNTLQKIFNCESPEILEQGRARERP